MHIRKTLALSALSLSFFTAAYAAKPPADPRVAAETAIRAADLAWSKAAEAHQLDAFLGFYSEDAMVLPANGPLASGKESLRKLLAGFFSLPGFALKFSPAKIEAARSGEMGWTQGFYELTVNDEKGNPVTEHGKYLEVWKKQADGSWKCAVDMFNADAPPPAPAPAPTTK